MDDLQDCASRRPKLYLETNDGHKEIHMIYHRDNAIFYGFKDRLRTLETPVIHVNTSVQSKATGTVPGSQAHAICMTSMHQKSSEEPTVQERDNKSYFDGATQRLPRKWLDNARYTQSLPAIAGVTLDNDHLESPSHSNALKNVTPLGLRVDDPKASDGSVTPKIRTYSISDLKEMNTQPLVSAW